MAPIDPTDRDLAKKRAREAAEADLLGLEDTTPWEYAFGYSHGNMPSLDFYDRIGAVAPDFGFDDPDVLMEEDDDLE